MYCSKSMYTVLAFFAGLTNVYDAEAENRSIRDVDKHRWALVPRTIYFRDEDINFVRHVFSFPVQYRYLRPPYIPGKRLLEHLSSQWTKEGEIDGFLLYRNTVGLPSRPSSLMYR